METYTLTANGEHRKGFALFRNPLFLILAFTFLFRLILIDMVSCNDPTSYCGAAKSLFSADGYIPLFHDSTRFGVVGLLFIFQFIFGTSPFSYYLLMIVINVALSYFLYQTVKLLTNEVKAFWVTLVFVLTPLSYIYGYAYFMHPYPEPFETLFALISFYFIAKYKFDKSHTKYIVLAALFMFCAYLAKETAVIIMLGGIVLLWKNKRHLLLYMGILLALFICETALYNTLAGLDYGRAQTIKSHFGDDGLGGGYLIFMQSPLGLLRRFVELKWSSKFLFFVFFIFTVFFLIRKNRTKETNFLLIAAWGFLLPITFAIKNVNPIQVALPFNTRYLNIVLPYVTAIDVMGVICIIERIRKTTTAAAFSVKSLKRITAALSILLLCATVFAGVFQKGFIHARVYAYDKLIDESLAKGMTVVSLDYDGSSAESWWDWWWGHRAINVLEHTFADDPNMVYSKIMRYGDFTNPQVFYVSSSDNAPQPEDDVLFVERTPFRVRVTAFKDILTSAQNAQQK